MKIRSNVRVGDDGQLIEMSDENDTITHGTVTAANQSSHKLGTIAENGSSSPIMGRAATAPAPSPVDSENLKVVSVTSEENLSQDLDGSTSLLTDAMRNQLAAIVGAAGNSDSVTCDVNA